MNFVLIFVKYLQISNNKKKPKKESHANVSFKKKKKEKEKKETKKNVLPFFLLVKGNFIVLLKKNKQCLEQAQMIPLE